MNWADYAILIILGLSALISIFRGFVREVLSLVGWVAAFWVALRYGHVLSEYLVDHISTPSVRDAAGFIGLFVATLVAAGIINFLVVKLIKVTNLSGTDRMLGVLFGLARGVAIVAIIVFILAGLTSIPADPWWGQSLLIARFEEAALWLHSMLPAEYGKHFDFSVLQSTAATTPTLEPPTLQLPTLEPATLEPTTLEPSVAEPTTPESTAPESAAPDSP